ncbi:MAG: SDR family oxidoreductase [Leptospiraceae bacterium]|nr:SDR family oxidoreductase [Leptospiraceae bacterium]
MKDKLILITGATDGIGRSTAARLAEKGYKLLIHGRNSEKLKSTKEEIINKTNNSNIDTINIDLSSLEDVGLKAKEIKEKYPEIYCLINNAGTFQKEKNLTKEGYEFTFTINHLAPFLLTNILLDNLKKGSPSRIINVSSIAHRNGKINFDNLNAEESFTPYGTYALSKLANILFTNELAKRVKDFNIIANSLHPGVIDTKLLRTGFNVSGASIEEGSENSVYLASSNEVKDITGKYFVKLTPASIDSKWNDPKLLKDFWEKSEEMVRSYL